MVANIRSQDRQQRGNQGQGLNPIQVANPEQVVNPSQGANSEVANDNMLAHILVAIQGLAQSNATTQSKLLEVV